MATFKQVILKEVPKWILGVVLAVTVFVAATYMFVAPLMNNAAQRVVALQAELKLQEEKLAASAAKNEQIGKQLDAWREDIGPLIDDKSLAEDLKRSLQHLAQIDPEQRDLLRWQRFAEDRLTRLEHSGRILTGEVNIGEPNTEAAFVEEGVNGWWKAERRVPFDAGYFRRDPVVFISVTAETFQHHEAAPLTYWVQPHNASQSEFLLTARVGNRPPPKFGGFRVRWIALEGAEADVLGLATGGGESQGAPESPGP